MSLRFPLSLPPSTISNVSGWWTDSTDTGRGPSIDDSSIAGSTVWAGGSYTVDRSAENKLADSLPAGRLVDWSEKNPAESSLTGGLNSSDSMMSVEDSVTLVLSAMGQSRQQNGQNQTISALSRTAARYSS